MITHRNDPWTSVQRAASAALAIAAFTIAPATASAQVGGGRSRPQSRDYPRADNYSFECSSVNGRYAECRVPAGGNVQLIQQLSNSPCRAGQTWGIAGASVWVNDGCRARFQVTTPDSRGAYGYPGGKGRRHARDRRGSENGYGTPTLVRCESINFRPQRCDVDGNTRAVRVLRSIGSTDCVQGQSWGYLPQRQEIWVDRGCRADFEVYR